MSQPMISIVLTTFNSEDTIADVLNAILEQDYPLSSVELIVVDGGSKDSTLEIVKSFLEKHTQLFHGVRLIVHDKNYGVSRARNDGIRASTGKFILILDHDVIMNRSTLANLLKFLKEAPENVAAVIPLHVKFPEGILDRWERQIREEMLTLSPAITSCALVRRDVIKNIGLYDETLGPPYTIAEDTEYAARAKSKGFSAMILGFEKVLHVDENKWKAMKKNVINNTTTVDKSGGENNIRWTLSKLIWLIDAVKSIKSSRYRYAYKRYLGSLPTLDRLRWYAYAVLVLLLFLLVISMVLSIVFIQLTFIVRFLFIILITLWFILYLDVLRANWNSKVIHISVVYSILALTWRILRSTILLMPLKNDVRYTHTSTHGSR